MENMITIKEAYKAMYIYLERLYEMTGSDDLAGFLGSMSTLQDGSLADEAVWDDWLEAVEAAKSNHNTNLDLKKP
jgi:hypothetical protein